jgi:phospholipase/carboxylesterase
MLEYDLIRSAQKNSARLVVMLHGLGDSMEGYRWFPTAMNLPSMNFALVNAPDEYYGGFSWFDYFGDARPGIERSYGMLCELLGVLEAEGFPANEITLGGFSQGCLMSLEVALRHPRKLAGIVGISGRASDPGALITGMSPVAKEQRMLIMHGTLDAVIPFTTAQAHALQLKGAGLNIEWREFRKEHTIIEEELDVIRDFVRAGYVE